MDALEEYNQKEERRLLRETGCNSLAEIREMLETAKKQQVPNKPNGVCL